MKRRNLVFALLLSLLLFSGCDSKQAGSTDTSQSTEKVAASSEESAAKTSITLLDGEKELSKKDLSFKEWRFLV